MELNASASTSGLGSGYVNGNGGGPERLGAHKQPQSKIPEETDFPYCRDVGIVYEKLAKIGQGTFGYVRKMCLVSLILCHFTSCVLILSSFCIFISDLTRICTVIVLIVILSRSKRQVIIIYSWCYKRWQG